MANRSLFSSLWRLIPQADTRNEAGGVAYSLSPEQALAQYAATGCLNHTFYATAETQLTEVLKLCGQVAPEYIAHLAVWARQHGHMKDMPALLCAVLATRDGALCERVFPQVIDNARMLRNFVQILRSGAVGRRSLGTRPRRLVRQWLEQRSPDAVFRSSTGNAPSLADVVRMVHPRPDSPEREALYGYLIGREYQAEALPALVREFEDFKQGRRSETPRVPFEMLTGTPLTQEHWVQIARNASWTMTRMNLNTFARHGVLAVEGMEQLLAERLADANLIRTARAFPYQLLMTYRAAGANLPVSIQRALHDAMEIATDNVPEITGQVYVMTDVSGSMHSPATGYRAGATSAVRCIDVAALVAACILRKNPSARVIPFHDAVVHGVQLSPWDTIMTNAGKLTSIPSGGTNCSAPLAWLNSNRERGDLIIYVSDNESWIDGYPQGRGTRTMEEWAKFRQRNPHARMICIDIQPYATVQAAVSDDILHIGGFSDHVFDVIADFAAGRMAGDHLVRMITEVELPSAAA